MGKLIVDLKEFTVVRKQDIGKDEPYLWIFGILVDYDTFRAGSYIIKKRPTDGNLGGKFKKGESRAISDNLGHIQKKTHPIFGLLYAGVIIMVWEHDGTPKDAQEAAYNGCVDLLNEFIGERVKEQMKDPDKDVLSEEDLAKLEPKIYDKVKKHFKDAVKLFKPGTWNPDDFIDFDYYLTTFVADHERAKNVGFGFRNSSKSAEYKLHGKITHKP
jgi:hypothetical protein